MKHLLSLEGLDVGRTLALTVGSPSAHRRGTKLKHIAFLLLFLLGSLNVWGAEGDVVYTLNTASGQTPIASSNSYQNYTDATNGWKITCGSTQTNSPAGLWLGSNSKQSAKMILSTGNFSEASGIASAISVQTSSNYYAAIIGTNELENVGKVTLTYNSTAGTAPSEAWILYSTDEGSHWSVGKKVTSLSTTGTDFDLEETIESARYAFVIHCSGYCQFKVPVLTFFEGDTGDDPGTPQPTVSANPNNDSYGSVEVSGMTITANPNDGYRVIAGDDGYDVTEGEATVVNNGDNTFTVTATEDCTVQINFEAIPPCTVTFDAGTGSLSCPSCNQNNQLTETLGGAGITLPTATPSSNCVQAGWEFYGWAESAVASTTNEPTLVEQDNGKYYPSQTRTLYAVYKVIEGAIGSTESVTFSANGYTNGQEITSANIGTEFATVSFAKGSNSNAPKYYTDGAAIRCYGGNTFTVATTSGNISAITLTFGLGDGSNTITADAGTYSNGSWTAGNVQTSSVKFTIGGSSGNRRVASIEVTIGDPGTTKYNSNPSCEAPSVEQPTFDLTDLSYTEPKTLHLSSTSEGAVIYYNITNDGTNPTDPTNASTLYVAANGISLDARKTYKIKAIAYVGENHSSITSATYTINLPYETAAELQTDATSTKTSVQVVFDEWIVTHVYTKNSKNYVYVVDEENHGLVIFGNESDLAFAVGERLSGTVTAGLQKYSGVTELLDMTKDMVETVTAGSVIPTVVTDFSTIDATNEGALVTLKDATYYSSNGTLSDGTHTIPYYNSFGLAETPDNGTKYDFTGIITKHNATYQIAPRSAVDMALAASTEFNVSSNVEGCTADANNPTKVAISAEELVLAYTLSDGYKWGTPVVTMGSATLTADDDYTWGVVGTSGTLTIMPEAFTGAINVTLNCEKDYGPYTFYDFSKISGFSGWNGGSYAERELDYTAATVTLANACRQTATITDVPVTKGSDVTIVLKNANKKISEVEFTCTQWSDKAQTITLWYSTDGGTTYQVLDPSVTASNFKISVLDPNKLPNKVNALKFTFSSSNNQVGIASAKLLIEDLVLAHPTVTLATNDDKLGLLYMVDENGDEQDSGEQYTEDDQLYIHTLLEEGCKLENLALSEDNGGASLTIENGDTILTVGTKNVTVTGTFAQYYTVSFNKNTTAAVENVPTSVEIKSGESFTIPTEQLTLTGKVFKGWNTNKDATEGISSASITINDNTELFAIWADPTDCTVKYYVNGVVVEEIDDLQQGETFNANKTLTEQQIPDGYEFEGWALAAYPKDELSIETVTSFTLPAVSEQPLYAVFSRTSQTMSGLGDYKKVTSALSDWSGDYLIAYSDEIFADGRIGGTATGGIGAVGVSVNPEGHLSENVVDGSWGDNYNVTLEKIEDNYLLKTKDGLYNYQTTNENGLKANTISYADDNPLSITFNSEDDIEIAISAGAVFHYNTSQTGYFRFYKDGGQQPIYLYKKETSVKVYTTNAVPKKTITFDANGGTGEICSTMEVAVGSNAQICDKVPTKVGYDFAGWSDGENVYQAEGTITNVQADIDLQATWNKAKYLVTIADVENGSVSVAPLTEENKAEFEAEETITIDPATDYTLASLRVYYMDGQNEVEVAISENKFNMPAYPVTVEATFEEMVYLTDIQLAATASVAINKDIVLTPTFVPANAIDTEVEWATEDEAVATVDQTGKVHGVAEGTVNITVTSTTNSNISATCAVTVTASVNYADGVWVIVSDDATLTVGDDLVIASRSQSKTAGDIDNQIMAEIESSIYDAAEVTSVIPTLGEGTVILTLGGEEDAWTLANAGNQLLGATAAKKLAWGEGTTTWEISISSNDATIQNGTESYGRMIHNVTSPRFTTYTSSTSASMLLPQLYRFVSGKRLVHYVAEDVVSAPENVLVNKGASITLPATPTHNEGHEFLGWSINGEIKAAGASVQIDENTTIYAKWEIVINENTTAAAQNLPDFADVVVSGNVTFELNQQDKVVGDVVAKDGATITITKPTTAANVVVEKGSKIVANAATTTPTVYFSTTMGSTQTPGSATQLDQVENITLATGGEIVYDLTLGVDMSTPAGAEKAANQWHAFTIPFPVDAINGIYNAANDEKLSNEVDYAIMDYHGDIRANGLYGWKKYTGTLQPGVFYLMTVNGDVQTFRFKAAKTGAMTQTTSMNITAFNGTSTDNSDKGWNGIGNPSWVSGKIAKDVYVLDPYSYEYKLRNASEWNFSVSTPFFYFDNAKTDATSVVSMDAADAENNYAPRRIQANEIKNVEVSFGNEVYTDQFYISASEDALNEFEQDQDQYKLRMSNTPKVAQIMGNAYGKQMAKIYAPLANNLAEYSLTLYAPNAGEYTISAQEMEDADLYLTQNGSIIWNLSMSEYVSDFAKGNNEGYGLLLIKKAPGIATGVDEISGEKAGVQKIVIEDKVFILRGGKMYDVTGKAVK